VLVVAASAVPSTTATIIFLDPIVLVGTKRFIAPGPWSGVPATQVKG
jgi:hypothetical protein